MEAKEIIYNILPNKKAYAKTVYLLSNYKDLKNGASIINNSRHILKLLDQAIEFIKDDDYFKIIELLYIQGETVEKTAEKINADIKTVYRQRKRLIKRISIIIYGDEAL